MRLDRRLAVAAAPLLFAALSVVLVPDVADACGGFFRLRATKTVTVPSLRVEQVLIVHDPVREEEHFIRELVFRDAGEPFGFVVPTPGVATVNRVETSPFASLAARFPPEPPEAIPSSAGGVGFGGGLSRGGGAPKVTVLSQQQIGSFTAFVLAATDAAALRKWLDDNHLASTPESDAWLRHYVDLGFYYVAFRYDPKASPGARPGSRSETVRLTFSTPLPYYPYLEPAHPAGQALPSARVLAVWLVSPQRSVPVAAVRRGDELRWQRPWQQARVYPRPTMSDLRATLGASLEKLLPPAPTASEPRAAGQGEADGQRLVLQTFEDQKLTRDGWGDVVLVPETPTDLDAPRLARMRRLMAALDPQVSP